MKIKKRKKGFTLIELVTAISVLIVLTAISAPIYNTYATKGKMTEGYTLIGTIRSAQDSYYNEYSMYLRSADSTAGETKYTNDDTVLGINARINNYYTWFNINDNGTEDDNTLGFKSIVESSVGNITLTYSRDTGVTIQ